jgi:micrococcal nuclease
LIAEAPLDHVSCSGSMKVLVKILPPSRRTRDGGALYYRRIMTRQERSKMGAEAKYLGACGTSLVLTACVLAFASPAGAASRALQPKNPDAVKSAPVTGVIDGDTIVLDTGAEVRLTGIQAPKLPLGRKGFRPWPLAREAKSAMESLSLRQRVRLDYTGHRHDRWGRLLAHVHAGDTWLQREMLLRGLARVYTFSDNRSHAADLYAAEKAARSARRGIWALNWYRPLTPEEADNRIGTFQLVEGTPKNIAIVRGRAYLNYGTDWKTDFTVSIASRYMKLFRAAGVNVLSMRNQRVRVRGWIVRRNGAMIAVTHPEQIEKLPQ